MFLLFLRVYFTKICVFFSFLLHPALCFVASRWRTTLNATSLQTPRQRWSTGSRCWVARRRRTSSCCCCFCTYISPKLTFFSFLLLPALHFAASQWRTTSSATSHQSPRQRWSTRWKCWAAPRRQSSSCSWAWPPSTTTTSGTGRSFCSQSRSAPCSGSWVRYFVSTVGFFQTPPVFVSLSWKKGFKAKNCIKISIL